MKFLRKNWAVMLYGLVSIVVAVGAYLYHDSLTLIHTSFIPYLIIAPGILYFSYQRPGRSGKILPLLFTILLFLLPLLAIWMNAISAGNIIGGLLPYNDASDYFNDALGLLDNQLFDGISVRRPIFTAFLSFLFALTGRNLQLSVLILVLINAVFCYLFAQQVKNLWGSTAAVTITLLIFFFYRRFIGTTLTEHVGLALGMAGSALLLSGARKTDRKFILFGVFLLSLGMNVRAGALLVLPVVILWGSWIFRGKSRLSVSFIILGLIAVSLGFLINWGTEQLVVDPEIAASKTGMFSNYSYTFYGLAVGGKGWAYINTDYPELRDVANKEAVVYEYAFESIRQNPYLLIKGMASSFADFFSPRHGAFSFLYASSSDPCMMEDFTGSLSTCRIRNVSVGILPITYCMISTLTLRIVDTLTSLVVAVLLLIPFFWGIFISYKMRDQAWRSILLAFIVGILLSVPLVPPRDASKMRAFAVTVPMMITVAAVGLSDLGKTITGKKQHREHLSDADINTIQKPNSSRALVVASALLALGIILSPIIARLSGKSPAQFSESCPAGLEARQFRFNSGSSIELTEGEATSLTWSGMRVPIRIFKSNLENFCVSSVTEEATINELLLIQTEMVLVEPAFLGEGGDARFAIISLSEVPAKPSFITICGVERNGVFYSQSAIR